MVKTRDTSRRAPSGVLWLAAVVSAACCVQSSQGRATWTTMAADRKRHWTVVRRRIARIRGGVDSNDGDRPPLDPPTNPRAVPTNPRATTTQKSFADRFQSPGETSSSRDPPPLGEHSEASATPLVASSAPLLQEGLPAGPVNPSSRSVAVLRLSSDGAAVETALSRQQLAAELNCPLRDLRMADPTFPGQFPSVLARRGSIIFSVGEVKAVILSNEVLLFPTKPDVLSIVPAVQEKIRLGIRAVPFEQTVMECCLKHVCKDLLESARNVEPRLRTVLDSFKTSKNSLIKSLHRLLPLKNELDELKETLVTVCKCMNEVLMNDEDMALMYLTDNECKSTARDLHQHQEIEMLFENYLLQVELLASDVIELQNEVRNTEEIVEIELDVLRNNILRFELLLSISGFTVALGALVTGVFGMNLLSGWEEKPQTFWQVTGGIYGCIVLSIAGTVALCRRLSLL
ncbi:unnamed protein product [Ectocarpus sp. 6 AP-2014]